MTDQAEIAGRSTPRLLRLLWILMAVLAVVSLVYGIQYLLGGPVRIPVVSELWSLALSPNGRAAAVGDNDGRIHIWRLPLRIATSVARDFDVAGEEPWPARVLSGLSGPVMDVGYAPDGSTLTAVSRAGQVRTWAADEDQVVDDWQAGNGPYVDLYLALEAGRLATLSPDGRVQLWDVDTRQKVGSFGPVQDTALAVTVSKDGSLVAAGDGPSVRIWNAATGDVVQTMGAYCDDDASPTPQACQDASATWQGHSKEITALAFSPDKDLLATGSADTTILFWDVVTGKVRWSSVGHWGAISSLLFSDDGQNLLSGGRDNKVRNFRVVGGKSTAIFEGHLSALTAAAYVPGENAILSVSSDGTLRAWETANQYTVHLEWSNLGLQPVWGKVLAVWTLVSGVLILVALWGMVRKRIAAHLLAMGLFLLGPLVVLGLPLFETLSYPLHWGPKLQVAWPLLGLLGCYAAGYTALTRPTVANRYETSRLAALADQLMISRRTHKIRTIIYGIAVWIGLLVLLYSVLRRFNLDISFMASFLPFIMLGSGITFYVSALSIVLAVFLALLGALGRLSDNPIAGGISGFYISLIRGTPLLVQIYIWYLGLPRLNIVLPATLAGILALGVNYGAYMTEIFRAGIQAIGVGQREAAQALGMSSGQTFRRIILPQAFRVVIPPIGNEFIAMMKDSSLVSVMAVQELTWRANKIGRQYFRGMETFIIAAAFYWILTVIFQLLQGRLEEHMARGERR